MIVDYVQNHLDVRLMQSLHQRLEFVDLLAEIVSHAVSVMQGEETERHIAPVIALMRIELKDGHPPR